MVRGPSWTQCMLDDGCQNEFLSVQRRRRVMWAQLQKTRLMLDFYICSLSQHVCIVNMYSSALHYWDSYTVILCTWNDNSETRETEVNCSSSDSSLWRRQAAEPRRAVFWCVLSESCFRIVTDVMSSYEGQSYWHWDYWSDTEKCFL